MKNLFLKKSSEDFGKVLDALKEDGSVMVHANYETFYGVDFGYWLTKQLSNVDCKISEQGYNPWYGYPDKFLVTLNH